MTCAQTARLLKAIADPTRLRLLCLLSRYESICVCELTGIMESPQYHVSRHLAVLRNLGLVIDERDGARVNYRVAPDSELLAELMGVLAPSVKTCPAGQKDLQRAEAALGKPPR